MWTRKVKKVQKHRDHIPRIIVCISSKRAIQAWLFDFKTSLNTSIVFRLFNLCHRVQSKISSFHLAVYLGEGSVYDVELLSL